MDPEHGATGAHVKTHFKAASNVALFDAVGSAGNYCAHACAASHAQAYPKTNGQTGATTDAHAAH